MKICFVGDVHGRVYHMLAAVLELQGRLGTPLDLVIQVGDMGAFPDPELLDEATKRWAEKDPSELHFSYLLKSDGSLAEHLKAARQQLKRPIQFVRGNHEDQDWLTGLRPKSGAVSAAVDPFDLIHYVPDGTVLDFDGFRVGYLGGVEYGAEPHTKIEPEAVDLIDEAGSLDLLVTHDGPYGIGKGYYGHTQGSKVLTDLIERVQPRYHVGGHYHQMNGPHRYGDTTYHCVAALFPGRQQAEPLLDGCLAVLDTEADTFEFVAEGWLRDFGEDFDFAAHFAALAERR
ncbi:MAG: metallophosphoesterase [Chloroflexi bacterium]|nr:metallophosphoesterase [Chloroflexota bacterium]